MTINAIYQLVVNYGLFAAGGVVVLLMLNRYRKIAASGNVRKMAYETAAPGIMLIVAIAVSGAAVGFALPRVNAFFASEQIQAAVAAGDVLTQAADSFLAAPAGGTLDSYQAPQFEMMSLGSGNQQPILPNLPMAPNAGSAPAGSLEALIESLAAPTLEATPAGGPAQPAQAAPAAIDGAYTVRSGDSMYKIAARLLGDGNEYVRLCNINRGIVGAECQLRPGMVIALQGTVTRNYVAVKDDYQPLVLRSAADVPQQRAQPTATAVPLVFMAAMNTPVPTPTAAPVVVPYVADNTPLVLASAQD